MAASYQRWDELAAEDGDLDQHARRLDVDARRQAYSIFPLPGTNSPAPIPHDSFVIANAGDDGATSYSFASPAASQSLATMHAEVEKVDLAPGGNEQRLIAKRHDANAKRQRASLSEPLP